MRHFHYKVSAYDKLLENGVMTNNTFVTINHAHDEEDAIEQAKKLVTRPAYRLHEIWECNTCQSDQEQAELKKLQKKMFEDQIKFLKQQTSEDEE